MSSLFGQCLGKKPRKRITSAETFGENALRTTTTDRNEQPASTSQFRRSSSCYTSYRREERTITISNATTSLQCPVASQLVLTPITKTTDAKKLIVKKTGNFYDNRGDVGPPIYPTHSKQRGKVFIMNNVTFLEGKNTRRGAEKDEKDLTSVLEQIGFKVKISRNTSKKELINRLRLFSQKDSLKNVDIGMVVIMSHGTNSNIPGGYTDVLCSDDKTIPTDDIVDIFNEKACPNLKNKPKIFIFQCCRDSRESDAIPKPTIAKQKSDVLIAYSTLAGFSSNRDPVNGTWYIQTLCDVLCEHAHDNHFEDLLKIVNSKMESESQSRQVPCYENRGFHKCYLHPI